MGLSELEPYPKIVFVLACSPAIIFLLHAVVSRIVTRFRYSISPQTVALGCAAVGNIPMAFFIWRAALNELTSSPFELAWAIIYSAIVYNALAYGYFHVFNMSETARRIRILIELDKKRSSPTNISEASYDATDILSARLNRLIAAQQIVRRGGRYVLGHAWLYYAARIVDGWAKVLGVGGGSDRNGPKPELPRGLQ